MTRITIIDVVRLNWPGEIEKNNVVFQCHEPGGPIFIYEWNVEGVQRPLEADLEQQIPALENKIRNNRAFEQFDFLISQELQRIARKLKYSDPLYLMTYKNSKNTGWSEEAQRFIDWRDSMYEYAIMLYDEMEEGVIQPPTDEQFMQNLPKFNII